MDFDPQVFLAQYADAYNARDPETLRSFFMLDDPRFGVFEDYTGVHAIQKMAERDVEEGIAEALIARP
jgi:hypothetical protein